MMIQAAVTEEMIKACKSWVNAVLYYKLKASKQVKSVESTGYLWRKKDVEIVSYVNNHDLEIPPLCRLVDMYYNGQPSLHEPETGYAINTISELTATQSVLLKPKELSDINELMEYYR